MTVFVPLCGLGVIGSPYEGASKRTIRATLSRCPGIKRSYDRAAVLSPSGPSRDVSNDQGLDNAPSSPSRSAPSGPSGPGM